MEENNQSRIYINPRNYTSTRLGPINYRNIVETIVMVLILHNVIAAIPFLLWVRVATEIIVVTPLFIFFLFGISDDSITEYIIDLIAHRTQKCNAVLKISPRKKKTSPAVLVADNPLLVRLKNKVKGD